MVINDIHTYAREKRCRVTLKLLPIQCWRVTLKANLDYYRVINSTAKIPPKIISKTITPFHDESSWI